MTGGTGDRGRGTTGRARTAMRILAAVVAVVGAAAAGVRMMALFIRPVVMIRAAAILVVPGGHALGSRHGGHALDRQGQGKQRDS